MHTSQGGRSQSRGRFAGSRTGHGKSPGEAKEKGKGQEIDNNSKGARKGSSKNVPSLQEKETEHRVLRCALGILQQADKGLTGSNLKSKLQSVLPQDVEALGFAKGQLRAFLLQHDQIYIEPGTELHDPVYRVKADSDDESALSSVALKILQQSSNGIEGGLLGTLLIQEDPEVADRFRRQNGKKWLSTLMQSMRAIVCEETIGSRIMFKLQASEAVTGKAKGKAKGKDQGKGKGIFDGRTDISRVEPGTELHDPVYRVKAGSDDESILFSEALKILQQHSKGIEGGMLGTLLIKQDPEVVGRFRNQIGKNWLSKLMQSAHGMVHEETSGSRTTFKLQASEAGHGKVTGRAKGKAKGKDQGKGKGIFDGQFDISRVEPGAELHDPVYRVKAGSDDESTLFSVALQILQQHSNGIEGGMLGSLIVKKKPEVVARFRNKVDKKWLSKLVRTTPGIVREERTAHGTMFKLQASEMEHASHLLQRVQAALKQNGGSMDLHKLGGTVHFTAAERAEYGRFADFLHNNPKCFTFKNRTVILCKKDSKSISASQVKQHIRDMLRNFPDGVHVSRFTTVYERYYDPMPPWHVLGNFQSIHDFLCACPEICDLRPAPGNNHKLVCLPKNVVKGNSAASPEDIFTASQNNLLLVCRECFHGKPQQICTKQEENITGKGILICSAIGSRHTWTATLVHSSMQGRREWFDEISAPAHDSVLKLCPYGRQCTHRTNGKQRNRGHTRNRRDNHCRKAHSEVELAAWSLMQKRGESNPCNLLPKRSTPNKANSSGGSQQKVAEEELIFENKTRYHCALCCLTFASKELFLQHLGSQEHAQAIEAEVDDMPWQCRRPPHGNSGPHQACVFAASGQCPFIAGDDQQEVRCVDAHSAEELLEWQQRAAHVRWRQAMAREGGLQSFRDLVLEDFNNTNREFALFCEHMDEVHILTDIETRTHDVPVYTHSWTFDLPSLPLRICLLKPTLEHYFSLNLSMTSSMPRQVIDFSPLHDERAQEREGNCDAVAIREIHVNFRTKCRGCYEQLLVFDFGERPYMAWRLKVKVSGPELKDEAWKSSHNSSARKTWLRWHRGNREIERLVEWPTDPLEVRYKPPGVALESAAWRARSDKWDVSVGSYARSMHFLLYEEERARCELLHRFSQDAAMQVSPQVPSGSPSRFLGLSSMFRSFRPQELLGTIPLDESRLHDSDEGRFARDCRSVLIASNVDSPRVFELPVAEVTDSTIVVRLPLRCHADLGISIQNSANACINVHVQLQGNRNWFCAWHQAVDSVQEHGLVPRMLVPDMPGRTVPRASRNVLQIQQWIPQWQPSEAQARIIAHAVLGLENPGLPPMLVYGSWGTGKTTSFGLAICELALHTRARVLVTALTNSAADLYILNYLHVLRSVLPAHVRCLRIYQPGRKLATVPKECQQHALISHVAGTATFRPPTKADIQACNVVVCTLDTAPQLGTLDLPRGFFTHVFIDEGGQALEPQALQALVLADESTNVLVAGDHLQMHATHESAFGRVAGKAAESLLVRLYIHYQSYRGHPVCEACRVLLRENYRSHHELVSFISRSFYQSEDTIYSRAHVAEIFGWPPLTLIHVEGSCALAPDGSWYNEIEAQMVAQSVFEFFQQVCSNPPVFPLGDIAVLSTESAQVRLIRQHLRDLGLAQLKVERVQNVQGKEFGAVFISTVMDHQVRASRETACGILADPATLNAAVTRAQSIVAVIGDAVALCAMGRCQQVWQGFVEAAERSGGLMHTHAQDILSRAEWVHRLRAPTFQPALPMDAPEDTFDAGLQKPLEQELPADPLLLEMIYEALQAGAASDFHAEGATWHQGNGQRLAVVERLRQEIGAQGITEVYVRYDGLWKEQQAAVVYWRERLQLEPHLVDATLQVQEAAFSEWASETSVSEAITFSSVAYRLRRDGGTLESFGLPTDNSGTEVIDRLKRYLDAHPELLGASRQTQKDAVNEWKKAKSITKLPFATAALHLRRLGGQYSRFGIDEQSASHKGEDKGRSGKSKNFVDCWGTAVAVVEELTNRYIFIKTWHFGKLCSIKRRLDWEALHTLGNPWSPEDTSSLHLDFKMHIVAIPGYHRADEEVAADGDVTVSRQRLRLRPRLMEQSLSRSEQAARKSYEGEEDVKTGILQVRAEVRLKSMLHVQLMPAGDHLEVQLLRLVGMRGPTVHVCVEHQHDPAGCFAENFQCQPCMHTSAPPTRTSSWASVENYVDFWRPLLEAEAFSAAVEEGQQSLLFGVMVEWKEGQDDVKDGTFSISEKIIAEQGLMFKPPCLLCMRCSLGACPSTQPRPETGSCSYAWVGHAVITDEPQVLKSDDASKSSGKLSVSFSMRQTKSCGPPPAGGPRKYDIEVIQVPTPYRYMFRALVSFATIDELVMQRGIVLKGVAHGCQLRGRERGFGVHALNESQTTSVQAALQGPFTLIQGPPGTGKTRTATSLALQMAQARVGPGKVLYCAPSNKAVDVAAEALIKLTATGEHASALSDTSVGLLRILSREVERREFPVPSIQRAAPVRRFQRSRQYELPKALRPICLHWRVHDEELGDGNPHVHDVVVAYSTLQGMDPIYDATAFKDQRKKYKTLKDQAERFELDRADILLATCIIATSSAMKFSLKEDEDSDNEDAEEKPEPVVVKDVIIDEAAMSVEPEILCPLVAAKNMQRCVLIGDHRQLQPVVQNPIASKRGYGISLFERLALSADSTSWRGAPVHLLNVQYRMCAELRAFPSRHFYRNRLSDDESVNGLPAPSLSHPVHGTPIAMLLQHEEAPEMVNEVATEDGARAVQSKYNPREAEVAVYLIQQLAKTVDQAQIAILTWYTAQVEHIRKLLRNVALPNVHCGTVVTAQGSEWDSVVLSTVRSTVVSDDQNFDDESKHVRLGIVGDQHTMNVAITRAKRHLVVVGNLQSLKKNEDWAAFLEHCHAYRYVNPTPLSASIEHVQVLQRLHCPLPLTWRIGIDGSDTPRISVGDTEAGVLLQPIVSKNIVVSSTVARELLDHSRSRLHRICRECDVVPHFDFPTSPSLGTATIQLFGETRNQEMASDLLQALASELSMNIRGTIASSPLRPTPFPNKLACLQFHEFEVMPVKPMVREVCDVDSFSHVLVHGSRAAGVWQPRASSSSIAGMYPYRLDPFQEEAIKCVQNRESVLVAAHTSAGKTVIAEAAIQQALQSMERVVFTAPLKALSNQKHRQLSDRFGADQVGILTGDVSKNEQAPIMVMTTEILHDILLRPSNSKRDRRRFQWVIFDEVHFLGDRERGTVWEEAMILLPETARFVLLSATVPNAVDLAKWLFSIKHQPVHVVRTKRRPVALVHHVFPSKTMDSHEVLGEDGVLNLQALERATKCLPHQLQRVAFESRMRCRSEDLQRLLTSCKRRRLLPVVIFSFSRPECERQALLINEVAKLTPLELVSASESSEVSQEIDKMVSTLDPEDQDLKQIANARELFLQGLGVHHGGLLPVLRQLVEKLFERNLLPVLFATETFGLGVDFPSRAAVFTQLTKFDGQCERSLTPGEYAQMSGRAGRRGHDKSGASIIMLEQAPGESFLELLKGEPPSTKSQLSLGTPTLLELLDHGHAHVGWFFSQSLCLYEHTSASNENSTFIPEYLEDLVQGEVAAMHALDLIDASGCVLPKGRVAAHFQAADSLLVTEIFFELQGFQGITVEQLAAFCSCLVVEERGERAAAFSNSMGRHCIDPFLEGAKIAAQRVGAVRQLAGLQLSHRGAQFASLDEWVDVSVNTRFAGLAAAWASRHSFAEAIAFAGDAFEGNVVRALKRTGVLLQELRAAASLVHVDGTIFEKALSCLHRGLVAADADLAVFSNAFTEFVDPCSASLPAPLTPGAQVLMHPMEIGFSHSSCSSHFRDGRSILSSLQQLLVGQVSLHDIERLRVVWHRCRWFTLGNRRLALYRLWALHRSNEKRSEDRVPVTVVSSEDAEAWGWQRKFTTGLSLGERARLRNFNLHVGLTRDDTDRELLLPLC